jgi:hypothetical protein
MTFGFKLQCAYSCLRARAWLPKGEYDWDPEQEFDDYGDVDYGDELAYPDSDGDNHCYDDYGSGSLRSP